MENAEIMETVDAAELARRYNALLADRDRLAAENARLMEAAEALLKHYEGDEPHPEERGYERWRRQLNVRLEELGVALAARALVEQPR